MSRRGRKTRPARSLGQIGRLQRLRQIPKPSHSGLSILKFRIEGRGIYFQLKLHHGSQIRHLCKDILVLVRYFAALRRSEGPRVDFRRRPTHFQPASPAARRDVLVKLRELAADLRRGSADLPLGLRVRVSKIGKISII